MVKLKHARSRFRKGAKVDLALFKSIYSMADVYKAYIDPEPEVFKNINHGVSPLRVFGSSRSMVGLTMESIIRDVSEILRSRKLDVDVESCFISNGTKLGLSDAKNQLRNAENLVDCVVRDVNDEVTRAALEEKITAAVFQIVRTCVLSGIDLKRNWIDYIDGMKKKC